MPRKRRTKLTQRVNPKLPTDEEDNHTMSEEEKKAKLAIFLSDFDIEVEKRIMDMRAQMKSMCSALHQAFNLEILRLPSHIREMKRTEFFGIKEAIEIRQEVSDTIDQLVASRLCQLNTSPQKMSSLENDYSSDSTTTQKSKKGKPKKKATTANKKKTASVLIQGESEPPRRTRRSKRSRASSKRSTQLATPANTVNNFSSDKYDTPFMTPKFDPRLPITPAMARLPKKGEVTMSISGSPVISDASLSMDVAGETSVSNELSTMINIQQISDDEMEKRIAEEMQDDNLDADSIKFILSKVQGIMHRILKNTADN